VTARKLRRKRPPTGKAARLELLLTAADKDRWQAEADRLGITLSVLVRTAVQRELEEEDPSGEGRLADLGRDVLARALAHEAES